MSPAASAVPPRYVFALPDADGESATVFTKHCGDHFVSADGVRVLRQVPRLADKQ